jgi:hypothetical protein
VKSNSNIKYINITLLALIGTMLLGAEAIAADPTKQGAAPAQEVTGSSPSASRPNAQDSSNKEVVTGTAPDNTAKKPKKSANYSMVGNMPITWIDYDNEYASQARKKFYHARPSEDTVAVFQRQIGETLVNNALLVLEAKRRKLKPDEEYVKRQLEQFERRFAKDPNWPEARPRVLPIITERIQNESLRIKLENLVRDVPPPSNKQLRKYYAAHPEKFTPPPQQHVAVIMLRMDPGAPDSDWQKASEQAQDLVKRIRAGEDFAELARQYSGDRTAEDGGDMGYLHEGMLPGLPELTVSKLKPGETSDPLVLMEGVAIFRLIERKQPAINSFKAVEASAKELLLIEQSDNAWNSLVAKLKKNTPVQVDESRFLPLPVVTKKAAETTEATKTETTKQ